MSQTPRNHSVTIAKAIAIVLMVMGHAGIPQWANHFISMMHMPLFFFMSGYCFKKAYLFDAKKWLQKRFLGVYWPYVKYGMVFVLLHNIFLYYHIYSETFIFNGKPIHYYSLQETIFRLVYVITMHGTERLLGGFWFLKALFWGSIIFYVIRKLFKNPFAGALLLLLLCFVTSFFHLSIPYLKIGSLELFAAFFIMAGHIFRKATISSQSIALSLISKWWLMIVFFIIVGIGSVYWPTSMLHYQWYHIFPYTITAIMGILLIFSIGNWIYHLKPYTNSKYKNIILNKTRKFLIFTGSHTLSILAWHFLSFKIVNLMLISIYNLNIDRLGDFPVMADYAHQGWWIIYLIVGVTLPISGTYLYHSFVLNKITPGKLT